MIKFDSKQKRDARVSISHWESIRDYILEMRRTSKEKIVPLPNHLLVNADNCELCTEYMRRLGRKVCEQCPLKLLDNWCVKNDSTFGIFMKYVNMNDAATINISYKSLQQANRMINWLKYITGDQKERPRRK